MKKILLLLTTFATLATVGSAKDLNGFNSAIRPISKAKVMRFMAPLKDPLLVSDSKTNHNQALATSYTNIDTISATYPAAQTSSSGTYYIYRYGVSAFFGAYSRPFYYDPTSGLYSYVKYGFGASGNLSDEDGSYASVYLRTSTNFSTWSSLIPVVVSNTDVSLYYPSVSTISGGGNSSAVVSAFTYNVADEINQQNIYTVDLDNTSAVSTAAVGNLKYADEDYSWFSYTSFVSAGLNQNNSLNAVAVGRVAKTAKLSGFGVVSSANLADFSGAIPANLSDDAFNSNGSSLYSSPLGLSKAGSKVYFGVAGQFANTENTSVGFSYTEDAGAAWSSINYAPYSVFQNFMNPLISQKDSFKITTNANSFVALSNGNVYFAVELTELNSEVASDSLLIHRIVEVAYEKNAWKIQPIYTGKQYDNGYSIISFYDENSAFKGYYSPSGREIQLAKTADEKFIVVKWLDSWMYALNTNNDLGNTGYLRAGARCVGNNTTGWTIAGIATAPTLSEMGAQHFHFLPNIVPNASGNAIKNIPLIGVESIYSDADATLEDSLLTDTRIDLPKYLATTKFSLTKIDTTVSVEENTGIFAQNLSIDNIYPNPNTGESVDLKLTLNQEAYTTIEIFDILGRLVAEPFSGYLASGEQFKSLTNLNLSSGSYRLVVTSNNSKASKTLNVAR